MNLCMYLNCKGSNDCVSADVCSEVRDYLRDFRVLVQLFPLSLCVSKGHMRIGKYVLIRIITMDKISFRSNHHHSDFGHPFPLLLWATCLGRRSSGLKSKRTNATQLFNAYQNPLTL